MSVLGEGSGRGALTNRKRQRAILCPVQYPISECRGGGGGRGGCVLTGTVGALPFPGTGSSAWRATLRCPVPGSVDALLRPAELFGVRPLAAPDLVVMLQTLVQARHPRSPADEALGRLWDRGGREYLEWKRRGFVTLGHRDTRCVYGGVRTST